MPNKISIHLLNSQAFCEYQIHLEYVKGLEAPLTDDIMRGKEIHEKLEKEHLEEAEEEMAIEEAMEKAVKEKITYIMREIPVECEILKGYIDEINFQPEKIIIIEKIKPKIPAFLIDFGKILYYYRKRIILLNIILIFYHFRCFIPRFKI